MSDAAEVSSAPTDLPEPRSAAQPASPHDTAEVPITPTQKRRSLPEPRSDAQPVPITPSGLDAVNAGKYIWRLRCCQRREVSSRALPLRAAAEVSSAPTGLPDPCDAAQPVAPDNTAALLSSPTDLPEPRSAAAACLALQIHIGEASTQALEASSNCQTRTEKPAVLHNLPTDSAEIHILEASAPAMDASNSCQALTKQAMVKRHLRMDATARAEPITLIINSAVSGERMFRPLQVPSGEHVSQLVRRLQHLFFTENPDAVGQQMQLACQDHLLDPAMPVGAAQPDNAAPSQELVLTLIATPVLLSWDQLVAMPAMRKRAGRGGKGACIRQWELRTWCFYNNTRQVDLSASDYNWRLLLKTMPSLYSRAVIGSGVVQFTFRVLHTIDYNYRGIFTPHWLDGGQRHVFEMSCANGDKWHLHFHPRGNCHLEHLPFNVLCQGDVCPFLAGHRSDSPLRHAA